MHLIPRIIVGFFSFLDALRKQHRLDWLINNRDLFPTALEAGSSRSGCRIVDFFLYLHMAERVQATSLATSHKGSVCMCAKSLQSCLPLCHPVDCNLPGSSVHGILQARILECVAMPSSRGSSQPRDQICIS